MRRRRDIDSVNWRNVPLAQSRPSQPWVVEQRQRHRDFPFWKLTAAIATAIVLAAAMIWTGLELRARYEMQELARQLEAEARRQEAVLQQRMAEQADARRREASRRVAAAAQRPTSRESSLPLLPQGTHDMPVGTIACMYGYQAQRQSNGSWKQLAFEGKARPCRTG